MADEAQKPQSQATAPAEAAGEAKPKVRKKKERKNIPFGIVRIQATFNNTIVSITEPNGNVVVWASAGAQGFKGSKKSTPFAAQVAAEAAARRAMDHGI